MLALNKKFIGQAGAGWEHMLPLAFSERLTPGLYEGTVFILHAQ